MNRDAVIDLGADLARGGRRVPKRLVVRVAELEREVLEIEQRDAENARVGVRGGDLAAVRHVLDARLREAQRAALVEHRAHLGDRKGRVREAVERAHRVVDGLLDGHATLPVMLQQRDRGRVVRLLLECSRGL